MRRERLYNDLSLKLTAPCPTRYLGEKLESAFAGSEIRHVQSEIRVKDSNEGDIGEMETFGNHLGADDDVDFSLVKGT